MTTATQTTDLRLAFLGNGYVRNIHRKPEPAVSLAQAALSGLAMAAFVVVGLVIISGIS